MKLKNPVLTVIGGLLLVVLAAPLVAPKAVHALAATLVQVTNTSSNPVINQDVDSPGRSPYSETALCVSETTNQCEAHFAAVPPNKRLVVEFIASSVDTPTTLINEEFVISGGPSVIFMPILQTLQGGDPVGNKIYIANQPMLYYFESGHAPLFGMNAQTGAHEFMSGEVTLSGYYVNLPSAPLPQ
jgi:hypothetical protein